LGRDGVRTVLVFTRTKSRANRLANFLSKNGIDAARIHGDRSQAQREKALAAFKNGRVRILVATDIAARGIDIEELSHVVNFDVPHVAEDYIHRVGRTARASRTGDAFTFVSPEEESDLRSIEKSLGRRLDREVPVRKSAVQVPRAAHQAARHARPAMAPSTGTWQHRTGAARTHRNDHRERAGTRPPRSTAESRIHHGGRHEDGRRTRDARARRVPERRRR
jgi:ATP-dependent RNA helicase RhlE